MKILRFATVMGISPFNYGTEIQAMFVPPFELRITREDYKPRN
jgi:hypothetical protein